MKRTVSAAHVTPPLLYRDSIYLNHRSPLLSKLNITP